VSRLRHAAVALALVAVTTLAACAGQDPAAPTSPAVTARPSSTATLTILQPKDAATVRGDSIDVRFELEGGTLVDLTTTDVEPDEGHLHVTLDGALVSMTGGLRQSLGHLPPGTHLLKAEFVAADHAPFEPRILAAVAFTVEAP